MNALAGLVVLCGAFLAPTFAQHPVQRLGEEASDNFSNYSCSDNRDGEKQRNRPGRAVKFYKEREKCENDEHVRQIHFVAALPETEQGREQARSFPLRLRSGNDHHASSDGDDGHIQTCLSN